MQKTETQVIDGISYTSTQFSATKGLKMFHRLGKYIGPALGKINIDDLKNKSGGDIEISAFAGAIEAFFSACPENEFESTIKELLTTTTRNNAPINFDLDFSGELGHLFKVLAFVFKVQFGNFFNGVKGLAK